MTDSKRSSGHHGQPKNYRAVGFAILAALLYGVSAPLSKLLLEEIPPTLMAALLYLGAGLGMLGIELFRWLTKREVKEAKMTLSEMPFIVGMILLDTMAPIFLMLGLTMTNSANASLLNNFEIVATSLIALAIFKETIGRRMWAAIGLITLSSMILSFKDFSSLSFSAGSIFIILACICWGFENNCTRMLSLKDPLQIVVVKGLGSGIGAMLVTAVVKGYSFNVVYILFTLLLGFVAYGMSIYLYISAQRELGAARTSAYYAAAPFMGVLISWILLKEPLTLTFLFATIIMLWGTYFAVTEDHQHEHFHFEEVHEHKHNHQDGHHNHLHDFEVAGEHTHVHKHEALNHTHGHLPDLHHRHGHVKSL